MSEHVRTPQGTRKHLRPQRVNKVHMLLLLEVLKGWTIDFTESVFDPNWLKDPTQDITFLLIIG